VPASITWAQYEQNLARLDANRARAETLGAVRHGPSLLAGLLVCGRCHCRMQVRYGGPRHLHSYTCNRLATTYGGDSFPYLPAHAAPSRKRRPGAPAAAFASGWSRPPPPPPAPRCRGGRRRLPSRKGRPAFDWGTGAWGGRVMRGTGRPATTA